MRHLPKAIPELDGGLFLPQPVVELLEAVLVEHQSLAARVPDAPTDPIVLDELQLQLRFTGPRHPLPPSRELLGLPDPDEERMGRNLLRHTR